jgi:DNA polymerase-3 subunit epsilon
MHLSEVRDEEAIPEKEGDSVILFFDTETTGLVQRDLPHDHPVQPDLVQLGMSLCDPDGAERAAVELLVRRDGAAIPLKATEVHGIDAGIADRAGLKLVTAASIFWAFRALADTIAAHHLDFDERVMATATHRAGRIAAPGSVARACTAEMAEPILRLPPTARMKQYGHGDKFKKPSLEECHRHYFGTPVAQAHSALADARACSRVYFALVRGAPPHRPTILERARSLLGWRR